MGRKLSLPPAPSLLGRGQEFIGDLKNPERSTLADLGSQLGHVTTPQRHGTTVPRCDAHILLSIVFPCDRHRDDPRASLEGPKLLAAFGVKRLDEAVRGTGEDKVSTGRKGAGP